MRIDVVGDTLCAQVAASVFAQVGNEVNWWLPEGTLWQRLKQGQPGSGEAELEQLLSAEQASGRLSVASYDQQPAKPCAPVVFISLRPGEQACAELLLPWVAASEVRLLVNQSVFPVGTTDYFAERLAELGAEVWCVAFPDLLQEGRGLLGYTRPDQIMIGCDNPDAEQLMRVILRPFNRRRDVIQVMRPREAEFSKLAISAMLATRLSFMNDMACAAEALDVDIERVRQAVGADSRIGTAYLYPGCGFGGPGFSRDVMSLAALLDNSDVGAGLLEQVLQINQQQKELLFRRFWQHFEGDVSTRKVALWGLSYKPDSERIDNAPSLALIEALWAQGVEIQAHDPAAMPTVARWAEGRGPIRFYDDPYAALEGVDALMLVTEWKSFWSPDWQRVKAALATPLVLDGRNVYDPVFMHEQGFIYKGVGRG